VVVVAVAGVSTGTVRYCYGTKRSRRRRGEIPVLEYCAERRVRRSTMIACFTGNGGGVGSALIGLRNSRRKQALQC